MSTANGEKVIVIDIALDEDNNLQKVTEDAITEVGFIKPYAGTSIPTGYLLCNGAAISRAQYPELFAAIGTTWGAGDGSSTFNVPDLRGYFLRGVGGNSAGFAVAQSDAIRNITGWLRNILYQNEGEPVNSLTYAGEAFYLDLNIIDAMKTAQDSPFSSNGDRIAFDASRVVPTAAENRPINKAVNYCIRYA